MMELHAVDMFTEPVPAVVAQQVRHVVAAHRDARCRVLDMRFSPGEPSHVLFEVDGAHVVGSTDGDGSPAVLSPIESDRALPGLRLIHDAASLQHLVGTWFPDRQVVRARADLLRYRPGRRATFAIHLRSVDADRRLDRRLVIAKVYHDAAKARAVHAVMTALAAVATGPELRLAPPVGVGPHDGIVGQVAVTGTDLGSLLVAGDPRAERGIDRAAVALAAMHRLPLVSDRIRSLDTTIDKLVRRSGRLAGIHPDAGGPLVDLVERIGRVRRDERGPTARDADGMALVHGDAKADQFLLADDAVTLLDLDHCGVGDPAGDVADFVAKIHQRSLASGRPGPVVADALASRFLDAYGEASGVDAGFRRRVALHTATSLARRALRSLQRAPLAPLSGRLLALGDHHLDMLTDDTGAAR